MDTFVSKLNEYAEFCFTSITNTYKFNKQMCFQCYLERVKVLIIITA